MQSKGVRVVCLRTGVVLDPKGGALAKLLPIFRLGAGGNLGSGQQYFSTHFLRTTAATNCTTAATITAAATAIVSQKRWSSWVSLRDLTRAIVYLASPQGAALSGPVNACAPQPCTNAQFTAALGSALSRPAVVPVPELAGAAIFGQMGQEMLFGGQKVST
eukprot:17739-Heterococcus_DN1.PRE.4